MNNLDWLYTMQPRDLARWFKAEHVEPNDNLSPEKGVRTASVDSNDANAAQDSREKLEADVRKWCGMYAYQADMVWAWLNRQAAITERECLERATGERVGWDCAECAEGLGRELDARCDPLKERIDELQAKVDGLTEERDELAEKLAESGELVNGGNAEDWYRCLEDMTRGKELIERSLTAENKRLRVELEQAKSGLKHQKAMRKKAESLVKDGQAYDMAELKAERDMWRERCGRMLDAAHEIERIAEVDG